MSPYCESLRAWFVERFGLAAGGVGQGREAYVAVASVDRRERGESIDDGGRLEDAVALTGAALDRLLQMSYLHKDDIKRVAGASGSAHAGYVGAGG